MGPKRTPKQHHTVLCALCGFNLEDAADMTYHLCAVHTGLDEGIVQDDAPATLSV